MGDTLIGLGISPRSVCCEVLHTQDDTEQIDRPNRSLDIKVTKNSMIQCINMIMDSP